MPSRRNLSCSSSIREVSPCLASRLHLGAADGEEGFQVGDLGAAFGRGRGGGDGAPADAAEAVGALAWPVHHDRVVVDELAEGAEAVEPSPAAPRGRSRRGRARASAGDGRRDRGRRGARRRRRGRRGPGGTPCRRPGAARAGTGRADRRARRRHRRGPAGACRRCPSRSRSTRRCSRGRRRCLRCSRTRCASRGSSSRPRRRAPSRSPSPAERRGRRPARGRRPPRRRRSPLRAGGKGERRVSVASPERSPPRARLLFRALVQLLSATNRRRRGRPIAPGLARWPPPPRLAEGGDRSRPRALRLELPRLGDPGGGQDHLRPPHRPPDAERRVRLARRRRRADHPHLPPVGGRRGPLRDRPGAEPAELRRAGVDRLPRRRRHLPDDRRRTGYPQAGGGQADDAADRRRAPPHGRPRRLGPADPQGLRRRPLPPAALGDALPLRQLGDPLGHLRRRRPQPGRLQLRLSAGPPRPGLPADHLPPLRRRDGVGLRRAAAERRLRPRPAGGGVGPAPAHGAHPGGRVDGRGAARRRRAAERGAGRRAPRRRRPGDRLRPGARAGDRRPPGDGLRPAAGAGDERRARRQPAGSPSSPPPTAAGWSRC